TDTAEDQRAERPDEEAGGVGAEGAEQGGGLVARREEQPREERRQDRVQVEVVPLEDGAHGGRDDDPSLLRCADDSFSHRCRRHAHRSPPRPFTGHVWTADGPPPVWLVGPARRQHGAYQLRASRIAAILEEVASPANPGIGGGTNDRWYRSLTRCVNQRAS